jgi:hypothetical protein
MCWHRNIGNGKFRGKEGAINLGKESDEGPMPQSIIEKFV